MAKLPEIAPRGAVTRGPQSSLSAAEIANPFQQIAAGLGDVADMFQKKNLADAETAGRDAVYRDASGNLQVDLRSNLSASGRTYNSAAEAGLLAQLSSDVRTRMTGLANDAKGNIDTFNSSAKAFRDQTLTVVPKDFRGAVRTMLDTEIPRYGLGVSKGKRKADIQKFEGNVKAEISMLQNDAATLARSGGTGTTSYREKQAQIKSLYQSLVDNPDFAVGQKQADIELKRMQSRDTAEAILGQADRAIRTGGVAAADKMANDILTDTSINLTSTERRQYAGLINERINGYVAQTKANLKPVQDRSTLIQKRLKEGVDIDGDDVDQTAMELARGGDTSSAMELYSARAMARTLQGFGAADNATQTRMAEDAFVQASGGDALVSAVRGVESEGDPNAESDKGASGLMQVMPGTGAEIAGELGDTAFPAGGTEDEIKAYLKNPDVSDRYGTHYLNKMLTRYGGDKEAALIAYNGGAARADAWLAAGRDDSVIPKESAAYYKKVMGRANSMISFSPEDVTGAKSFLQGRTDKDASHILGLDDAFAVKVSRLLQAAPPEIRDKLGIYSGARSNERQAELFADAVKRYGSEAEARKWVAPPGKSNHNHGKAADLSFNGQSLKNAPADVVKWLHDNAGAYGLKFPLGNEKWHIEDDSTRGGVATARVNPEIVKEYRQEITTDAKSLWTDIKSGYDKGMTPAVSDLNLLTRQLAVVDDSDFRREVADFLGAQSAVTEAMGMAPGQLESLVSTLRSDAADGATIAQQQIISGIEAASTAKAKALADDPLGYAMSRGFIGATPALDLTQPDSWAGTFQTLQNGVDVLRNRGEVGNISALRPAMQAQVSKALAGSTPQDAVQLLGSMAANLSPETYMATLNSIASKGEGKAAAAAGALVGQNPEAAEGILRGTALLRENPLFAPKKNDDNTAAINDILPPTAFAAGLEGSRQTLLDAARARYADLSSQAGDISGDLNDARMQQAISEVTGGLVEFNGGDVVAPRYGMTQDQFDEMISRLGPNDLAGAVTPSGQPVSVDELRSGGRLRAIADGRYVLEFGPSYAPTSVLRAAPHPLGGADKTFAFVLDLRDR